MILDSKDALELRSFESQDVKFRAAEISAVLVTDQTISEDQKETVNSAMLNREDRWGEYREREQSGEKIDFVAMQAELDNATRASLLSADIGDAQVNRILEHEMVVARPVKSMNFMYLFVAFLTSFVVGIFACKAMITLVKKARLTYFSIYCVIVGTTAIVWSLM
jgi:hypothetical protein